MPKHTAQFAFILAKRLIAITIIGILAVVIIVVVLRHPREPRFFDEFSQLDLALKTYKDKYGEYPPDGTDTRSTIKPGIPDAFYQHFKHVFPKANLADEAATGPYVSELGLLYYNNKFPCDPRDADALQKFFQNYTPATALPFWLGGMQEENYSVLDTKNPKSHFVGFSANPIHPLSDSGFQRRPTQYEFSTDRISVPNSATASTTFFRSYQGNSKVPLPFIYFRAELNQTDEEYMVGASVKHYPTSSPLINAAKPYWDQVNKSWINPKSYQILSCGFDSTFGTGNVYPSGKWISPSPIDPNRWQEYDKANFDDITNFAGGTIGNRMP